MINIKIVVIGIATVISAVAAVVGLKKSAAHDERRFNELAKKYKKGGKQA